MSALRFDPRAFLKIEVQVGTPAKAAKVANLLAAPPSKLAALAALAEGATRTLTFGPPTGRPPEYALTGEMAVSPPAPQLAANQAMDGDEVDLPPAPEAACPHSGTPERAAIEGETTDPLAGPRCPAFWDDAAVLPEPGTPERVRLDGQNAEMEAGLLAAAKLRPPAWSPASSLPSAGCRCSCCGGGEWWAESVSPKGWRCRTCHPPDHLAPDAVRVVDA